jgi:hypothetical protein
MKHKHYDMIVAWAEGKQIQNFNENTGEWQDLIGPPYWIKNFQYRIKPEEKAPVVRWLWAFRFKPEDDWYQNAFYQTDEEASDYFGRNGAFNHFKLEYTRQEFPE